VLWRALRDAFPDRRFRRQHPIGRYIVDFACPANKLAIEIDGSQHAAQVAADERRSEEIGRHGYRVIRFWNNALLQNLDGVLRAIEGELAAPVAESHRRGRKPLSALKGGEGGAHRRAMGG
jgi:very-short-patch-repair endonuclease